MQPKVSPTTTQGSQRLALRTAPTRCTQLLLVSCYLSVATCLLMLLSYHIACSASTRGWWPVLLSRSSCACPLIRLIRLTHHTQRIDEGVVAATRALGAVFAANDLLLARGR